jgi:hypothetical protein
MNCLERGCLERVEGHPNHDASLTSKALITSAHVVGHDANPTNTIVSSDLEFALSSLLTSFVPYTSSARRGGDPLGAASSVATPLTSSPTAPRGRSSTPPTSTTTPRGMTTVRATTKKKYHFEDKKKKFQMLMS